MTLVFRTEDGQVVNDAVTEKAPSPTLSGVAKEPIVQEQQQNKYTDGQVRKAQNAYEMYALNKYNPLGFLVKPAAAGLISAFSDEDYPTVRRKLDEREQQVSDIMAENDPVYKKSLDAIYGGGGELADTAFLLGAAKGVPAVVKAAATSKIPAVSKAAKGAIKVAEGATKVPGIKQVWSGMTSGNPFVRAGTLSGVSGLASTGANLYQGDDLATAGLKGLGTATNVGGYSLLGNYAPKLLAVAAPVYEMGKGYLERNLRGEESTAEDFARDVGRGVSNYAIYSGMRPNPEKAVKGSPKVKAVDTFKKAAGRETPAIQEEYKGIPRSTPILEAQTVSSQRLAKAIGDSNPKNVSAAKIKKARDLVGKEISKQITKEMPGVEADVTKMEANVNKLKDKVASVKADLKVEDRVIPREQVDKYLKPGSDARSAFDKAYDMEANKRFDVARPDGNYRAASVLDTKEALNTANGPIETRAKAGARRLVSKDWNQAMEYKKADMPYSKARAQLDNLHQANKYNIINQERVYNNMLQELEKNEVNKGLRKFGLTGDASYVASKKINELAKKYDFLSDQYSLLTGKAPDIQSPGLFGKAISAGVSHGSLPKYALTTEVTKRAIQSGVKKTLNELSKLKVGDVLGEPLVARYRPVTESSLLAKYFGEPGVSAAILKQIVDKLPKQPKTKEKNK